MKITINGQIIDRKEPCRISELFENKDYKYMAANVNNRLRELDYIVKDDANIQLLDLTDSSVTRIYQSTLRYVVLMACKNVFPKANIVFN